MGTAMNKYVMIVYLIIFSGNVYSSQNNSSWSLIPSEDAYWIKTTDQHKHGLLVAYQGDNAHFLLILQTDSSIPDKPIAIKYKIDKGQWKNSHLILLEKRADQSIFKIDIDDALQKQVISEMIAGLNWSIKLPSGSKSNKSMNFSLLGFTVVFNDLLIANKIGTLDPAKLIKQRKDHELYCLLTTEISIQAIQKRLKGKSYSDVLHTTALTHYSLIDDNIANIITQVYNIPYRNLSYEPRAEKYIMFNRCLSNHVN